MTLTVDDLIGSVKWQMPAVIDLRTNRERTDEGHCPAADPHLLDLVVAELGPAGGRVLDFGCGSGRYALPLARRPGVSVLAYDSSTMATQQLTHRCVELAAGPGPRPQLEVLCGSLEHLEHRLEDDAGFDVVLLTSGVLARIESRACRLAMLRALRARLRPGGRLIVAVPGRRRGEADGLEPYRHRYTPAELCAELAEAGFAAGRLRPETVLNERFVQMLPLGAAIERVLRRVAPPALGEGLVAVARPFTMMTAAPARPPQRRAAA